MNNYATAQPLTTTTMYIAAGAYEPPKAARSVQQLRRTAFAFAFTRAFSAFRIRTDLDYGEYPLIAYL